MRTFRWRRCCCLRRCGRQCAPSIASPALPTTSPMKATSGPEVRLARLAALRSEIDAIEHGAPQPVARSRRRRFAYHGSCRHNRFATCCRPSRRMSRRTATRASMRCATIAAVRPTLIGRLLLALHRRDEASLHPLSDAICTGLQLTNFWQDIANDWRIGRVYLPQEDLQRCGVDESSDRRTTRRRALARAHAVRSAARAPTAAHRLSARQRR
jgi:hypothetical protein